MTRVNKRVPVIVMAVLLVSFIAGCSGMEKSPAHRHGYTYYHAELVQADRALDEARAAGKDRECPAEYNALKEQVDRAYAIYYSCRTQEAINLANDATAKIKALCPRTARTEARPEPMPATKVAEKVILLEDVHFANDRFNLTPETQAILRRNIQVMKQNPSMKIRIQGHTSAVATEEYNQSLSERRAKAVEDFLRTEGGISPDRLSKIGYGETRLERAEPNPEMKESAAAQVNRRVIFKIIVE